MFFFLIFSTSFNFMYCDYVAVATYIKMLWLIIKAKLIDFVQWFICLRKPFFSSNILSMCIILLNIVQSKLWGMLLRLNLWKMCNLLWKENIEYLLFLAKFILVHLSVSCGVQQSLTRSWRPGTPSPSLCHFYIHTILLYVQICFLCVQIRAFKTFLNTKEKNNNCAPCTNGVL